MLPHSKKKGSDEVRVRNTANLRIIDGVLETPSKAEVSSSCFIGRENLAKPKGGHFASSYSESVRLPDGKK